ncbi:transcriptional regulator [Tessaracoccus antarcticus]|uniref:Transcriptional regulator n=2 Tax=Tessaracoccus antarcticus TaxID=2479848 RepID=A0A3M0FYN9_9ACTN|nr:transcriptional regulator [Tessaracoccus antarcticus]
MIDVLMDGTARPAGELAAVARVSAATASEHLAILVAAGLLRGKRAGRQRLYSILDQRTAEALESLGQLCVEVPISSLVQSRTKHDLADARMCYDHVAGRLGVELFDASVRLRWFDSEAHLTARGERALSELGVAVPAARAQRRPLTRTCPDWTQRRPHLAGALGAALTAQLLERRWITRRSTGRGLIITADGLNAIQRTWGIDLTAD